MLYLERRGHEQVNIESYTEKKEGKVNSCTCEYCGAVRVMVGT